MNEKQRTVEDIGLSDSKATPQSPIAIIGIGCLFPKSEGKQAFWANISGGVDAITEVPESHWKLSDFFDQNPKSPDMTYGRRGGFISAVDFSPIEFGIAPNSLEAIDTSQLLGLVVAKQALDDAGYTADRKFDRDKVSVILGVTGTLPLVIPLGARLGHPYWRKALEEAGVQKDVADDVMQRIADSYVGWQEESFPGLLGNVVAGRIAKRLELGGTNCVVDAACASSLSAVHLACLELQAGRSDMVLTGGVDTFNDIFMYMCFSKTPALSPTGDARPFAENGDGTILGEGLGMVMLKRLEDAERDGDRIYAVLKSIGTSSDGKGEAIYAPSSSGQSKALRRAYEAAGVTPDTIELIEAHGTGTKVGDQTELNALIDTYSGADKSAAWCALGSVKSQIGHTKAAAGVAGLIKATLALYQKVIPPSIKAERPLASMTADNSPFYLSGIARPWIESPHHPRRAALSAFGFGGSNFHCVLEEHEAAKKSIDWNADVEMLALSAAKTDEISRQLDLLSRDLDWNKFTQHAVKSRSTFQPGAAVRLVLVAHKSTTDLQKLVGNAMDALDRDPKSRSWSTPDGAYFGAGAAEKIAFLFPGQGAQYTGMLRDLACRFPQIQAALATANKVNNLPAGPRKFSEVIFPPPAYSKEAEAKQTRDLAFTANAQPALGALSAGTFEVLKGFGVTADFLAGHSFGELTALHAAGRFDQKSLQLLAGERGRLMASQSNDGSMLAVFASADSLKATIESEKLDLVIANKNSPNQVVLSGKTAEIERAERVLEAKGIKCSRLNVSSAFHSSLVSGASRPLRTFLDSISMQPTRAAVFANTTAQIYPSDDFLAKDLLANQLAKPVEFVDQIQNMHSAGARTFVEVGPGSVLTGLVRKILEGKPHVAVAVDASSGKRDGMLDLARTLAQIAVCGHPIQIANWNSDVDYGLLEKSTGKKGFTVSLSGVNYTKPKTPRPPRVVAERPKVVAREVAAASSPVAPAKETPLAIAKTNFSTAAAPATTTAAAVTAPAAPKSTPVAKPSVSTRSQSSGSQETRNVMESNNPDRSMAIQSLRITQENLTALQQLQQQTASVHQKFLEGQDLALQTMQAFFAQQHRMVELLAGGAQTSAAPLVFPAAPIPAAPPKQIQTVSAPARQEAKPVVATPSMPVSAAAAPLTAKPIRQEPAPLAASATKPAAIIEKPKSFQISETEPTAPAATQAVNSEKFQTTLLEVVAEKTGYPLEILELDMSLDADLGIDSIKRVEILSSLQERLPEAPSIKPEHLGTLQTLRAIVEHLCAGSAVSTKPAGNAKASAAKNHAATVAAPAVAQSTGGDRDHVQSTLLSVVAEKTGYPLEILELDMSLDADLGIDSIKRVEILSAIQEKLPNAPVVKPDQLGSMQTLRAIVEYLAGGAKESTPAVPPKSQIPAPFTEAPVMKAAPIKTPVEPALSENKIPAPAMSFRPSESELERSRLVARAVPQSMIRDKIRLPKELEIWVTDDSTALAPAVVEEFAKRGYTVRLISADSVLSVDDSEHLAGLVLLTPLGNLEDKFLTDTFEVVQLAGPALRRAGRSQAALVVSVSRMDGSFGLGSLLPDAEVLSGGLAGLIKTVKHEWPEVQVRAIDLASDYSEVEQAAEQLVDELFFTGPIEVGISSSSRVMLELEPIGNDSENTPLSLSKTDVVVVTGGGRGVTAESTIALAKAVPATYVLFGRNPLEGSEPAWLTLLTTPGEMKEAIARHSNGPISPKQIESTYRSFVNQRQIRATLSQIEATGSKAEYRCIDVRNEEAVRSTLADIRAHFGPIRGIIHGAGVLADKRIDAKTIEQFQDVFSTKVVGYRNLLQATAADDLLFIAAFSSSTGRFGRNGQSDYAVANELLNKLSQREARRRPTCRVVSFNWGPWAGGMVNDALAKIFHEEGVGLISLAGGAECLIQEISQPAGESVETVVIGKLAEPAAPRIKHVPSNLPVAFERIVSVEELPILRSHVIDGRAVLPVVMSLEWLAHGAVHENPGLIFHGVNDFFVHKGLIVTDSQGLIAKIHAGKVVRDNKQYLVPVELTSVDHSGRETHHIRAQVVLVESLPDAAPSLEIESREPYSRTMKEIYGEILFHGPGLKGISQLESVTEEGVIAWLHPSPAPLAWIKHPLRKHWLSDPLALDAAFQAMILWTQEFSDAPSLPCAIRKYRQFQKTFPKDGVRCIASITERTAHKAMADIEFLDGFGNIIAKMDGYECVIDRSLKRAFRHNQLV